MDLPPNGNLATQVMSALPMGVPQGYKVNLSMSTVAAYSVHKWRLLHYDLQSHNDCKFKLGYYK